MEWTVIGLKLEDVTSPSTKQYIRVTLRREESINQAGRVTLEQQVLVERGKEPEIGDTVRVTLEVRAL